MRKTGLVGSVIFVGLCAGTIASTGAAWAQTAQPEVSEVDVYAELSFQTPVQLIIAQKKGFFEKFGLKVKANYYQSASDVPPGMVGGSIVISHGGLANPLVVQDQGHPVKILAQIADWSRSTALVVQPELGGKTPADLAGKTMISPDIPVLRLFWSNWAKAVNIDPASVKWLNAAPSDSLAAFLSKQSDLMIMWAPAMNKAIEAGGVKWQDGKISYLGGKEEEKQVYWNWGMLFMSEAWYKQHPKTAEAYLSGLYLAQAYIKCHRDEVIELVSAEARIDPALGRTLMAQNDYDLEMNDKFLAEAQFATDFYTSAKILKNPYKITDLVDRSLYEKVSKSVEIPADWNKCQ